MLGLAGTRATEPDSYDQAVLSEIQMVMEFIAGTPDLTVKDLEIADPEKPDVKLKLPQVAAKLQGIEATLGGNKALSAAEKTLLLSVRDAVNTIVRPASGVSIAYTALVLKSSRGQFDKARSALAQRAFPGLVAAAAWHRRWHLALIVVAACLTFGAVWESTKVALGQALLRGRADLRVQQLAISTEKLRLEAALARDSHPLFDKLDIGKAGQFFIRLCERPRVLREALQPGPATPAGIGHVNLIVRTSDIAEIFESPEQQDVCDRDRILANHFASSTQRMKDYQSDWPKLVGAGFPLIAGAFRAASDALAPSLWTAPASPQAEPADDAGDDADLEYRIAPALLVTGNYILPVLFAMLGASAHAVLDFYKKARANLLRPGDRVLSWIRLMLGIIIGACVGLFFNSGQATAPAQGDGLVAALTLSASGLAFIAGYGVEGVFSMLNVLVGRVFDTKPASG